MKHIICSSFGKDSNATALLALQHGEPLDEIIYTEVMFSKEISGELPEHARFIYETAIPYFEKRGIPTRVLHAEKTYLDCFYHVVSRGNAQGKLAAFPLAGRCAIQRDCKVPPLEAYAAGGEQGHVQMALGGGAWIECCYGYGVCVNMSNAWMESRGCHYFTYTGF